MADVNSDGPVAEKIIENRAAELFMIAGRNVSAADIYVQLHDAALTPANGATAKLSIKVLAGENFSISYPAELPRRFAAGIYICSSTTDVTKTLSASNDITFDAQVLGSTQ